MGAMATRFTIYIHIRIYIQFQTMNDKIHIDMIECFFFSFGFCWGGGGLSGGEKGNIKGGYNIETEMMSEVLPTFCIL